MSPWPRRALAPPADPGTRFDRTPFFTRPRCPSAVHSAAEESILPAALHGDGGKDVACRVMDVDSAFGTSVRRGATPVRRSGTPALRTIASVGTRPGGGDIREPDALQDSSPPGSSRGGHAA